MNKVHMIFWGELVPNTMIGTSISSSRILEILKEKKCSVIEIEEFSWNKGLTGKTLHYFYQWITLFRKFTRYSPKYFYFMLPPSKFGLLKSVFILPVLKIIRPSAMFTAHVHRGDLPVFYCASILNRFLLKFVLIFVDKLIFLSPELAAEAILINFNKEITFLRNTSSFEMEGLMNKKEFKKRFLCVSNYLRSKGIVELVNCFAAPELQEFTLEIFGNIYEKDIFEALNSIRTRNISLNGPIDRESLRESMSGYDALILPSWNEGQPTILIEAMSLGLPVIASHVGDVMNMLGKNYPFLFAPGSAENIKNAVLKFSKSPEKNFYGDFLYSRYSELFSNKIYLARVIELFR